MKGQCLCTKVKFDVVPMNYDVHVCHCGMCRVNTSGVIMSIDIEPKSLIFESPQYLGIYDSSEWGERGFCKHCGTHLFWRLKNQEYCNVNAFSLEIPLEKLNLHSEIFIDHKPEFYGFKNTTKQLTEADVLALISSST